MRATVLLLLLALAGCRTTTAQGPAAPATAPAADGEAGSTWSDIKNVKAQDFALKSVTGQKVRLSDHRGKVVLLDFWATWCEPCKVALPLLEALQASLGDQGLVVLTISMDDPSSLPSLRPLARSLGFTLPILLDQDTRVTSLYNPKRTAPYSVIIDRQGLIRKAHQGFESGDEIILEREIRRLLAEP